MQHYNRFLPTKENPMEKLPSGFRLPILTYHHISDDIDYYTCVSPKNFREHITQITQEAKIISLDQAIQILHAGEDPQQTLALTFDDGYRDIFTAMEWLSSLGLPATAFIPSDYIDRDNLWNHKATYIASSLTKEVVRLLSTLGHEIGSHGRSHQCLTKLHDSSLEEELIGSSDALTQITGQEIKYLAYPFGFHNARVRELAANIYAAGFATEKTAPTQEWNDTFAIHRLSVGSNTTMEAIMSYIHGNA